MEIQLASEQIRNIEVWLQLLLPIQELFLLPGEQDRIRLLKVQTKLQAGIQGRLIMKFRQVQPPIPDFSGIVHRLQITASDKPLFQVRILVSRLSTSGDAHVLL